MCSGLSRMNANIPTEKYSSSILKPFSNVKVFFLTFRTSPRFSTRINRSLCEHFAENRFDRRMFSDDGEPAGWNSVLRFSGFKCSVYVAFHESVCGVAKVELKLTISCNLPRNTTARTFSHASGRQINVRDVFEESLCEDCGFSISPKP